MVEFFQAHWTHIYIAMIVLVVFISFVKEWSSPDVIALGAFVAVLLGYKVNYDRTEILAVFNNGATIVVGAMFVISAALEKTGVIKQLSIFFERLAGKSKIQTLVVMMIIVAVLSAIVNNTPVVVIFLPIILSLSKKRNFKSSKLLIPLSYAAIVGGTCTVIGTSTNVIVMGSAAENDAMFQEFGIFEITKLGLVYFAITFVYLLLFSEKLLPERIALSTVIDSEKGKEYLTHAVIQNNSPLIGKKVADSSLAKNKDVKILEVHRNNKKLRGNIKEIVLLEKDKILVKTRLSEVVGISENQNLVLAAYQKLGISNVSTESAVLMEGMIGMNSKMLGKTVRQLRFFDNFGSIVLAIHRHGQNLKANFQDIKLAFGDTLLLEGNVEKLNSSVSTRDFINLSVPTEFNFRKSKAPIAIFTLFLFITLGAFKILPLMIIALLAVFIILVTRCIRPQEAYEAIEWRIIFMIIGMLGLGKAVEVSQTANFISESIFGTFGEISPFIILSALYLFTAVITEIMSNNAVAALMTPIAIGIAHNLEVSILPFIIAVMFASSASFSTPIGYQTNTFVYGAGGYRFKDFFKIGFPLSVILWIVASFLIPYFWKF